jgi:cysteinyl-tRNA synthetase
MLKIYNTLARKVEEFKPIDPHLVRMYACGPTVYDYQHIGHMRRYVGDDILIRVLKYNGFEIKHVMNITDVGHLTSDADTGEDKMEKGAEEQKLSVWELAKKFENQFFQSMEALNIVRPNKIIHATEAIEDQIELIRILEEKGFTYKTSDGVYFDTSKFKTYGELTGQNLDELKAGARVDIKEKKNPTDFALWKFSPEGSQRQMEWDSPWGKGFPGWHVECSAMSMKALGPTFDIHTGGIDHIPVHHTNEIAQSEAASGKKFVNYWIHHAFLLVEGEKMSKSLGNYITVQDVEKKGFDPLALRYLFLQTHYKQEMNFTWDALEGSQRALERLKNEVSKYDAPKVGCAEFEEKFEAAINNDLNMPEALAIVHELIKSDYPTEAKAESMFKFDEVLGLNLRAVNRSGSKKEGEIPEEIQALVEEREKLRKERRFHLSDQLRNKIVKMGYDVHDIEDNKTEVVKKK